MYAEGSLKPVSRCLSQEGHPCHSGIQVGGCREGIGLSGKGRMGTLGCLAPEHSVCWRLPLGLWSPYQTSVPLTILAALCPWKLGLCLSCHHPLPPHVMWGREQHLYCASIRTQLFTCARAPAKHKAILKYCIMVQSVGFLAFLPWL